MKHTFEKLTPDFTPIKLEIIIESQAELDALGTLFNHNGIHEALKEMFPDSDGTGLIYQAFSELKANMRETAKLSTILKEMLQ